MERTLNDHATPNLPSADLTRTSEFYADLGFTEGYRDDGWMILSRAGVVLEFFPWPDVDPASTAASCCLRLDDVDAFVEVCRSAGVPEVTRGWPRVRRAAQEASGLRIGALVDPDGNLLRLVENP